MRTRTRSARRWAPVWRRRWRARTPRSARSRTATPPRSSGCAPRPAIPTRSSCPSSRAMSTTSTGSSRSTVTCSRRVDLRVRAATAGGSSRIACRTLNRGSANADDCLDMTFGALTGVGAATLALAASAPPLSPSPPPAPKPAVSRAPARTVTTAIARAEALGAITARRAERYRLQWHDAYRASRTLTGARRDLVAQSVSSTQALAASGALRAPRLAAAIAAAHASAQYARSKGPLPAAGGRVRIPGDSTVYSYRPPYGLQVHPLGTIGKLNALATTCTEVGRKRGWRCRRAALIDAADRLLELSLPARPAPRLPDLFR